MKASSLKSFKSIVVLLLFIAFVKSQLITQVDFKYGASQTGSVLWGNFVGVSLQYDNIQTHINNTLFQAYQRNAILKGDWSNAWVVSMKVPLGHKFGCANLSLNNPVTVICHQDTLGNNTYWKQLGNYIKNTVYIPYWFMGFDLQGVNLTNYVHNRTMYNWGYNVWASLGGKYFGVELVDYGNKMVEKGYKIQYTPDDFLNDIYFATTVITGVPHNGPGITQDAGPEWLLTLQTFKSINPYSRFSIRCTIFPNPAQITIQKILSDNSTKYYLEKRFTVNDTYRYSNFVNLYTGINDLKLTQQPGVDGVTNTFAATIWALDFLLEFALLNGYDVDFNHKIFQGNFQSILGPAPGYKPSPIYYAMIFATLIRQQSPKVIMPSQRVSLSSKIKAFGLTTGDKFKILLINKDTNTSLNGTVNVYSRLTGDLSCLNMEAPSLQSKDNITIAGYNFIEGNATVNGTLYKYPVSYDHTINGWKVPIKYSQVIFCTTADKQFEWPKSTKMFGDRLVQIVTLSVIIMIFAA